MRCVVDASVALSFLLRDEGDERTVRLLKSLKDNAPCVPSIWHAEVVNGLMQAERRRRIDAAGVDDGIVRIEALGAEVDDPGPDMLALRRLATTHRLTAYDALYLELAMRRGLPLATNDHDLAGAARRAGVSLL